MTIKDLTAIARGLAPILRDHLALITAKERGLKGEKGDPGEGRPGRDGLNGLPGRDGTRGEKGDPGTPGANGRDGRDGTLENLKAAYDGERTVTLCYKDTGQPIEGGVMVLPIVIDRGVWTAGKAYERGDGVTWGGSFWIAQMDTKAKPGDGSGAWRLAVKRGGDGKDGKQGPKGEPGSDGSPGRDLTQKGFDGSKW